MKRILWFLIGACLPILAEEVSYNTDRIKIGPNLYKYSFSTAEINFKDPADGKFKKNDLTLRQDEVDGRWKMALANYHAVVPEFSDEWFEFVNVYKGANQTIRAKPVAAHVKGTMADNVMTYTDAFGLGVDLTIRLQNDGFVKTIAIKENPGKDLDFDFELDLPAATKVINQAALEWNKAATLDFTGKKLKITTDKDSSFFSQSFVWDSRAHPRYKNVKITMFEAGGKTFLRKTIPLAYFDDAGTVYPVMTDHPTNYSPTTGCGFIGFTALDWPTVLASSAGTALPNTSPNTLGSDLVVTDYSAWRLFVPIDAGALADDATILTAKLWLYKEGADINDNDGDDWMNVVQTTQVSTTTLVDADFDQCGGAAPTEGGTRVDLSGLGAPGWKSITFNATGISWIEKVAISQLGVREGHDVLESAPLDYVDVYFTGNGGANPPYLEVTATGGATVKMGRVISVVGDLED